MADKKKNQSKRFRVLQEPDLLPDKCSVMISYSRLDKEFVTKLDENLREDKRQIFIDLNDTPPNNDWIDHIYKGIESSDVFLFVLSNNSIASDMCKLEVEHATKNGKRVVPIVIDDVDFQQVSKEISSLNWIFFNKDLQDFDASMELVLKACDADYVHAMYHTKLLVRAIEWERHDFEKSLLLSGDDLKRAKYWLSASALGKEPKPTTLHLSFITASDTLSSSMKKRKLIAVFFAFIVAIGIIWPSWGVFFFSLVFSHFFVYFSSN